MFKYSYEKGIALWLSGTNYKPKLYHSKHIGILWWEQKHFKEINSVKLILNPGHEPHYSPRLCVIWEMKVEVTW